MATLSAGTRVMIAEMAAVSLRFPPPPDSELTVVAHPASLSAPHDPHTQVAAIVHDELIWLGALGEDLLERVDAPRDSGARAVCADRFLVGGRLWEVVRPGLLVADGGPRPLSTVYDGSELRPWVIVGETILGEPIAVPLGDARNPKWWTPVITQTHLHFPGNIKDGQLELAHAWTLPADVGTDGSVLSAGRSAVEKAIERYFGTRRLEELVP